MFPPGSLQCFEKVPSSTRRLWSKMLAASIRAAKKRKLAAQVSDASTLVGSEASTLIQGPSGDGGKSSVATEETSAAGKHDGDDEDVGSQRGSQSSVQSVANSSYMVRRMLGDAAWMCFPSKCIWPSVKWWVKPMQDAVALRWDRLRPRLARPLRVSEACAGLGTAIMTLLAMGIPVAPEATASDLKDSARNFVLANFSHIKHVFNSVESQMQDQAWCYRHGGMCCPGLSGADDLLVMGPPCQAYSRQRGDRYTRSSSEHPGSTIVESLDGVVGLMKQKRPRGFVLENVLHFAYKDPITKEVGIENFLERLAKAVVTSAGDPYYSMIHVFEMDPLAWINMHRPRTSPPPPAPALQPARCSPV